MKEDIRQMIYRTLMLIVIVAIITFVITSIINYDSSVKFILPENNGESIDKQIGETVSKITEILEEKYIGEINNQDLVEGAIKGAVEALNDEYTEYYTSKELEEFETSTLGSFTGIGVYLQADPETDSIKIVEPISGSPAEKAGLKADDIIVGADGTEYNADQINDLSDYIKGEAGTEVTLTISRNGKKFDVKVKREEINLEYVESGMLESKIGYISITSFDEDSADDFLEEYNKLLKDGAKSLVIDLRDNGGGLVDQALEIADLFCEKDETTLITIDKNGNKEITKSQTSRTITMPTIILTNENTASASEILTAALKENDKAETLGTKTFGKGVIQELIYLSNGGALKVTTAEYYTPKGNKINEIGITPTYQETKPEDQLERVINILKNK